MKPHGHLVAACFIYLATYVVLGKEIIEFQSAAEVHGKYKVQPDISSSTKTGAYDMTKPPQH
jgi:hypothetical protein